MTVLGRDSWPMISVARKSGHSVYGNDIVSFEFEYKFLECFLFFFFFNSSTLSSTKEETESMYNYWIRKWKTSVSNILFMHLVQFVCIYTHICIYKYMIGYWKNISLWIKEVVWIMFYMKLETLIFFLMEFYIYIFFFILFFNIEKLLQHTLCYNVIIYLCYNKKNICCSIVQSVSTIVMYTKVLMIV